MDGAHNNMVLFLPWGLALGAFGFCARMLRLGKRRR
ncbi:hypothetical protein FB562_0168 [Homoserinimonas aerilata]|uniref:Uncharacterized protein n=1 Tax=Homoserinimonas aerilata TaxID=1162970 RepID=A0A542YGF1_9MICO|nr:hypothetical protein FB562_0168 [Homoserinimonas aerilata]